MIEPGMKVPPADSSTAVTSKYTEAFNLNARIRISAQMAQQNLYEVCNGLKEMRDGKLYKELGYQNFEAYCESEVGIKHSQAYKMISVIEKLPPESFHTCGNIKLSKLYLLSTLSDEERTEITENNDLESVSVRELKKQIDELKIKADKADILSHRLDDMNENCRRIAGQRDTAQNRITDLEAQIQELEARPVEVAVQTDSDEVEKLKSILKQTDLDWAQKYNEMEDENIRLRRADSQKHAAEIESIKKEYEEKLAAVPKAEAVPDTKEVFKAYLSNAVDSANRLLSFLEQHKDELFIAKSKELFGAIAKKLEV